MTVTVQRAQALTSPVMTTILMIWTPTVDLVIRTAGVKLALAHMVAAISRQGASEGKDHRDDPTVELPTIGVDTSAASPIIA